MRYLSVYILIVFSTACLSAQDSGYNMSPSWYKIVPPAPADAGYFFVAAYGVGEKEHSAYLDALKKVQVENLVSTKGIKYVEANAQDLLDLREEYFNKGIAPESNFPCNVVIRTQGISDINGNLVYYYLFSVPYSTGSNAHKNVDGSVYADHKFDAYVRNYFINKEQREAKSRRRNNYIQPNVEYGYNFRYGSSVNAGVGFRFGGKLGYGITASGGYNAKDDFLQFNAGGRIYYQNYHFSVVGGWFGEKKIPAYSANGTWYSARKERYKGVGLYLGGNIYTWKIKNTAVAATGTLACNITRKGSDFLIGVGLGIPLSL